MSQPDALPIQWRDNTTGSTSFGGLVDHIPIPSPSSPPSSSTLSSLPPQPAPKDNAYGITSFDCIGQEPEPDQGIGDPALSIPPASLNGVELNTQEQNILSSKPFPFKLYLMLEDKTMTNYVAWSKSGGRDAFVIPDIDAFTEIVLPKYFKEMNQVYIARSRRDDSRPHAFLQWGSFQKQLNNYGFKKQDRGTGRALYAHSGNKFRKCRPDLLRDVARRSNKQQAQTSARQSLSPEQQPSPPILPTPNSAPIQPRNQTSPQANEDQLEHENKWLKLKLSILELKRELENSDQRQAATEDRLQATENRLEETENRLRLTENRLLDMGTQLFGFTNGGEPTSMENAMPNSTIFPVQASYDVGLRRSYWDLVPGIDAGIESFGTHLTTQTSCPLVDSLFSSGFSVALEHGAPPTRYLNKHGIS
ncbi:hypothetical protein FRC01_008820 [Tulasnella sp. 417]|nr:hypothetical protein FRC01_008820 [Tulasnella sp. 417]